MRFLLFCCCFLWSIHSLSAADTKSGFKAGVAVRVITPEEPHWMAGYGGRTKPAETKQHELFVKALAIEDAGGDRVVVLSSDLVGIHRTLSQAVADEVRKQTGLPRARLMFTCSHTHCGPVLDDSLIGMYDMPDELRKKVEPYTKQVHSAMVEVIVAALKDLSPARVSVGMGRATFAVNRREPTDKGVTNRRYPAGPVDHSVPVLRVDHPDGKLRAMVFGYACHNTTMQFYEWCGDYAGFAQAYLEERHPGAKALFWIGCGGDANPLPRSKIELCKKYGEDLADAVDSVLAKPPIDITGKLQARYAEIAAPLGELPGKEKIQADALSKAHAVRSRALMLLKTLEKDGKLDDHYRHYPVQVWRLGEQTLWLALGGEVVVDYSLRLKRELLGTRTVWVTGYANDVMAYIPSARVVREGGYEGDSSMVYYGLPTKWSPDIEDKIVDKVHELVKDVTK